MQTKRRLGEIILNIADVLSILFFIWIVISTINILQYNNLEDKEKAYWKYNAYNYICVDKENAGH